MRVNKYCVKYLKISVHVHWRQHANALPDFHKKCVFNDRNMLSKKKSFFLFLFYNIARFDQAILFVTVLFFISYNLKQFRPWSYYKVFLTVASWTTFYMMVDGYSFVYPWKQFSTCNVHANKMYKYRSKKWNTLVWYNKIKNRSVFLRFNIITFSK